MSWPVRKYKAVFFRYSISTKSFIKWPVLKQLKTGTVEAAVGNQGVEPFINWLVFVKKVKISGHFYHWNFGSSGHMITRSALQSVPLTGNIPSPWTLKKCCFSPWTPGGIYHLSLSFYERSTMLLSPFLFCTYCMTRPRDSRLDLTNMLLVAQLSIMPFSFQNLFNHCYCDHLDITSRCCIIVIYITIITNPHWPRDIIKTWLVGHQYQKELSWQGFAISPCSRIIEVTCLRRQPQPLIQSIFGRHITNPFKN